MDALLQRETAVLELIRWRTGSHCVERAWCNRGRRELFALNEMQCSEPIAAV